MRKPQGEVHHLTASLRLNKHDRMLYIPFQFRDYGNPAVRETGAIPTAISENEVPRIFTGHPI